MTVAVRELPSTSSARDRTAGSAVLSCSASRDCNCCSSHPRGTPHTRNVSLPFGGWCWSLVLCTGLRLLSGWSIFRFFLPVKACFRDFLFAIGAACRINQEGELGQSV